jgi:hypothetical protein
LANLSGNVSLVYNTKINSDKWSLCIPNCNEAITISGLLQADPIDGFNNKHYYIIIY